MYFGGPEVKPGSSNMSSLEREEDLAPTGVSCSITCISDITEWDTALKQETHTHLETKQTTLLRCVATQASTSQLRCKLLLLQLIKVNHLQRNLNDWSLDDNSPVFVLWCYLLFPKPMPSLSACSLFLPSMFWSFFSSIFRSISNSLYAKRIDATLQRPKQVMSIHMWMEVKRF